MTTKNQYLIFSFGDNDFGWPIKAALQTLWKLIYQNNNHCLGVGLDSDSFSSRSIADIFVELHKCGSLQNMLRHLYIGEQFKSNTEHATRGLYWTKVKFEDHSPCDIDFNAPLNTWVSNCISFDKKNFKFYKKKKKFMSKWGENGEAVYLNLKTGKCHTF